MTGGLVGANPDQLDELAVRINSGADTLEGIRHAIRLSLGRTDWPGPDGDQFRHDWDFRHARVIATAVTALREAARALRVNADQQRDASNSNDFVSGALSMARSMLGPVSHWEASEGPDGVAYANLAASIGVGALALRLRYYGPIGIGFSSALTIAAITEGVHDGWRDENIGKVTLGVVGIGLAAAGIVATGGVGAAVFGAGALISTLSTQFPAVNAAVGGVVREVGEGAQAVWHGTTSVIDNVMDGFTGALGDASVVLPGAGRVVSGIAEAAGGALSGAIDGGKKVLSKINPFD